MGQCLRAPKQFKPSMREVYKDFFHQCLKNQIYLAPSAFEVGFMSLAHDEDVLAKSIEQIKKAVKGLYA